MWKSSFSSIKKIAKKPSLKVSKFILGETPFVFAISNSS